MTIFSYQIKAGEYNPLTDNPVFWIDPSFTTGKGNSLEQFRSTIYDSVDNIVILRNRVTMCPLIISNPGSAQISFIGNANAIYCNTISQFVGYEANVLDVGRNQQDFTIFTVMEGATDSFSSYFGWGNSADASNNCKVLTTSATGAGCLRYYAQNSAGSFVALEDSTTVSATGQIVMWRSTSGIIDLRVGNVSRTLSGTSTISGTVNPNRYTFGCFPGSGTGQYWPGTIGDHIVYPYSMNLQQISRVYRYLSLKFGIS